MAVNISIEAVGISKNAMNDVLPQVTLESGYPMDTTPIQYTFKWPNGNCEGNCGVSVSRKTKSSEQRCYS